MLVYSLWSYYLVISVLAVNMAWVKKEEIQLLAQAVW